MTPLASRDVIPKIISKMSLDHHFNEMASELISRWILQDAITTLPAGYFSDLHVFVCEHGQTHAESSF